MIQKIQTSVKLDLKRKIEEIEKARDLEK